MNTIQHSFTCRNWSKFSSQIFLSIVLSGSFFFSACSTDPKEVKWDYKIDFGDEIAAGVMKIKPADNNISVTMFSYDWGTLELEQVVFEHDRLSGVHDRFELEGTFANEEFKGKISNEEGSFTIVASRQSEKKRNIQLTARMLPT